MAARERLERQTAAIANILGIVRTMKTLAAVNIPAAERAATSAGVFHRTVLDAMAAAVRAMGAAETRVAARPGTLRLAIGFGTDHGLCGGFNDAVAAHLREIAAGARIFAVGGRLEAALARDGLSVERVFRAAAASDGLRSLSAEVILALDAASKQGEIAVTVVHQTRSAAGGLDIVDAPLLPLSPEFLAALARRPWPTGRKPMLPGVPSRIFRSLARQHLALSLYGAGAQSLAAEHGTRLALMSHAEKELERRRDEIEADRRRTRQAGITDELLDILSGFEAIGPAFSAR
ncbi:MAG: F0F1 ATP synthase subunit gamma [Paracoccaceae bacterium]